MEGTKEQKLFNGLKNFKNIMNKCNQNGTSSLSQKSYQQIDEEQIYQEPIYQEDIYQEPIYQQPTSTSKLSPASSNLPKSILESITSNPIIDYSPTGGISVLDSIMPKNIQVNENIEYDEKPIPTQAEMINKVRNIREQKVQQPTMQVTPQQVSIDYSLIKMIIEECVAKEIKALKKSLLTESKGVSSSGDNIILMSGNPIKFINKNGDVFEGILKKTRHIDL